MLDWKKNTYDKVKDEACSCADLHDSGEQTIRVVPYHWRRSQMGGRRVRSAQFALKVAAPTVRKTAIHCRTAVGVTGRYRHCTAAGQSLHGYVEWNFRGRIVTDLSAEIGAPALERAINRQCADVICSGRKRYDTAQRRNGHGHNGVQFRATVTKLIQAVVAPAPHRSIGSQRAVVFISGRDRDCVLDSGHLLREIRVEEPSGPQLTVISRAPTPDRAACGYSARVKIAC
jgi:hypothetical protein